MKHNFLFAAFMLSCGFSAVVIANPACNKLADMKRISQKMSAHPQVTKKAIQSLNRVKESDCMAAEWRYLSERLTFRGIKSSSSLVSVSAPIDTIRYSPAAMYSANAATPIAFLKRPDVHANYLPTTDYARTPIQQTALHLIDEVPTSNYQGSLATPIIYQTGHWNVGRY